MLNPGISPYYHLVHCCKGIAAEDKTILQMNSGHLANSKIIVIGALSTAEITPPFTLLSKIKT